MPNHLKAIFFDIDDTLYSTSEFSEMARSMALDAMIEVGLAVEKKVLHEELEEVINEFSSNYEHHFDKLLLRIPKRYYRGINPGIIVAAGVIAYHDTKIRRLTPYEDAIEVLRILSKADVVLGVITEGLEVKQAEKLVRMRINQYLSPNAIFISNQIQAQPEDLPAALQRFELEAFRDDVRGGQPHPRYRPAEPDWNVDRTNAQGRQVRHGRRKDCPQP